MSQLTWNLDFDLKNTLRMMLKDEATVEGHDWFDFHLLAGETRSFLVQPAEIPDLLFMLIRAEDKQEPRGARPAQPSPAQGQQPPPKKHKIYYTINGYSHKFRLANQHLLIGGGVMDLLPEAPKCLTFTNEGTGDATVTVLIGRKVGEPGGPVCQSADETTGGGIGEQIGEEIDEEEIVDETGGYETGDEVKDGTASDEYSQQQQRDYRNRLAPMPTEAAPGAHQQYQVRGTIDVDPN